MATAQTPLRPRRIALRATAALLAAAGLAGSGCGGGPARPPTRELYVASLAGNSIVTFGLEPSGAVITPAHRVIRGPATGLNKPAAVYALPDGRTFVANRGAAAGAGSVTEYAAGARGNAEPDDVIEGAQTELARPNGIFAGYFVAITVTNAVEAGSAGAAGVLEFDFGAGSAAPAGRIAGAHTTISGPMSLARAPGGTLLIAEPESNRIVGWDYPSGTTLDAPPAFVLGGPSTLLDRPAGVAFDGDGLMYVVNRGNSSVTVYSAGANGDAAPLRRLGGGSASNLVDPVAIAVDDAGNLYVSQGDVVLRFNPGASGAAAAAQRIEDPALRGAMGLAIR